MEVRDEEADECHRSNFSASIAQTTASTILDWMTIMLKKLTNGGLRAFDTSENMVQIVDLKDLSYGGHVPIIRAV